MGCLSPEQISRLQQRKRNPFLRLVRRVCIDYVFSQGGKTLRWWTQPPRRILAFSVVSQRSHIFFLKSAEFIQLRLSNSPSSCRRRFYVKQLPARPNSRVSRKCTCGYICRLQSSQHATFSGALGSERENYSIYSLNILSGFDSLGSFLIWGN